MGVAQQQPAAEHERNQSVLLTLEFVRQQPQQQQQQQQHGSDPIGTVKKVETKEGARLTVGLPRIVDSEQANLAAALLLEEIDRFDRQCIVDRIKVSGLRFTSDAVEGMKAFFSTHASTVRHLSFKNVVSPRGDDSAAAAVVASLAEPFESSDLQSLNLSENSIGAFVWRCWRTHVGLKQLVLDHVEMDESSVVELASRCPFKASLEDLYVVLTRPVSVHSIDAVNAMLGDCKRLLAFRWVNASTKDVVSSRDVKLPWLGLTKLRMYGTLAHLVMEGSESTEEEIGHLIAAVGGLPRLLTLKLRNVGMRDSSSKHLARALRTSCPHLQCLDLSGNMIQSDGARAIALMTPRDIKQVILDRNQIDIDAAREVVESFAASTANNGNVDLRMEGNHFSGSILAFRIAKSKGRVENERDTMIHELERCCSRESNASAEADAQNMLRRYVEDQASMIGKMEMLQREVQKLTHERDLLIKAFSVMGAANQVEEQRMMYDRISHLEQIVLGSSSNNVIRSPSKNTSKSPSGVADITYSHDRGVSSPLKLPFESGSTPAPPPPVGTPKPVTRSFRRQTASHISSTTTTTASPNFGAANDGLSTLSNHSPAATPSSPSNRQQQQQRRGTPHLIIESPTPSPPPPTSRRVTASEFLDLSTEAATAPWTSFSPKKEAASSMSSTAANVILSPPRRKDNIHPSLRGDSWTTMKMPLQQSSQSQPQPTQHQQSPHYGHSKDVVMRKHIVDGMATAYGPKPEFIGGNNSNHRSLERSMRGEQQELNFSNSTSRSVHDD